MSEKKTAEIKLRIEPSVKAQWQQSAADEGIGLSELVVKAVAQYRNLSRSLSEMSLNPSTSYSPPVILGEPTEINGVIHTAMYAPPQFVSEASWREARTDTTGKICDDGYACLAPDCSCPKEPVPTSEAEKKFGEDWKPWENHR